jgi:hypothetical protein
VLNHVVRENDGIRTTVGVHVFREALPSHVTLELVPRKFNSCDPCIPLHAIVCACAECGVSSSSIIEGYVIDYIGIHPLLYFHDGGC